MGAPAVNERTINAYALRYLDEVTATLKGHLHNPKVRFFVLTLYYSIIARQDLKTLTKAKLRKLDVENMTIETDSFDITISDNVFIAQVTTFKLEENIALTGSNLPLLGNILEPKASHTDKSIRQLIASVAFEHNLEEPDFRRFKLRNELFIRNQQVIRQIFDDLFSELSED